MSQATPPQQNALLKVLEDDTNNFIILHSSKPLLTTIESRMQVIAHPDDKFAPVVAGKPQERQEDERLRYRDKLPADERNLVIRALKALHDHDGAALNALAVKWTDTTTEALRQWSSEAISQQWKQFDEEDSLFSGVQIPLAILLAISKNVRPKLVVRAGLAALI